MFFSWIKISITTTKFLYGTFFTADACFSLRCWCCDSINLKVACWVYILAWYFCSHHFASKLTFWTQIKSRFTYFTILYTQYILFSSRYYRKFLGISLRFCSKIRTLVNFWNRHEKRVLFFYLFRTPFLSANVRFVILLILRLKNSAKKLMRLL